jgi:predicted NBD/HSP70 family sugar kinase
MADSPGSPGSLEGLRLGNRRRVLDVMRQRGTASRTDVVRLTGLSRSTVSTLVGQLVEDAVLVELPERASAAPVGGRPATLLRLNPSAGGAVGVHLAHDHVRVAVTDLAGDVLDETLRELDVDHLPHDTLTFVGRAAMELVERAGLRPGGLVGMGVAVSAPVQLSTHALGSPILPDWSEVDVVGTLHGITGLRVEVGNDANLGAIAERRYGAAQGVDDFVYVMLSDGVGAGLVLRGQLYEGATGGAGEIGHVAVVPEGYVCRCGNRGCLETVAGSRALATALAMTHGPDATVEDLVVLAARGEPGAQRVLTDAGCALGRALTGLCTVLDPAMVVLGGKAAASSEHLRRAVRDTLQGGVTPMRRGEVPVVAGALGERAEVLGAVALVAQVAPLP